MGKEKTEKIENNKNEISGLSMFESVKNNLSDSVEGKSSEGEGKNISEIKKRKEEDKEGDEKIF